MSSVKKCTSLLENGFLEIPKKHLQVCLLGIVGLPESDSHLLENDSATGMSRTSSISANRSTISKKGRQVKQRRDDSDGFDSRHQYTPYWGPQQQTWVPQPQVQTQYPGPAAPYPSQAPIYIGPSPPVYGQQAQPYPGVPATGQPASFAVYPAVQVR